MSIYVQDVIDNCLSLLDAENSDRYRFESDFKPAINDTQKWLVLLYNKIFGLNQVSEESLKELISIRCFKASNYSRISMSGKGLYNTVTLNGPAVDNGDGTVRIPCATAHGFSLYDYVTIVGTNYAGEYRIVNINSTTTFDITKTYVAETLTAPNYVRSTIEKIWRVIAVYPEIETIPTNPTLPADADESAYLSSVAMRKPLKSATRLTLNEWAEKQRNPLLPGSDLIINDDLIQYGYLNFADYNVGAYSLLDVDYELEIAPDRAGEVIGLAYLRLPRDIIAETDYLPFPENLTSLVVAKTINFISIKEDDKENLYKISENEVNKFVQLLT